MLTLHDLQIQAMIYNELVVTFRIWTRPTNMSSRISSNLITVEREGLPYMGYMSMCHEIGLSVFEVLDPYKGYHFCPCLHCIPSVILRQATSIVSVKIAVRK